MAEPDPIITSLKYRLRSDYDAPGVLAIESVVVKEGPKAYKTATILTFGDKGTGEVKKRELRVQTWEASVDEPGYDFHRTAHSWHCEDSEIDRVRVLLERELPESGSYVLIRSGSGFDELAEAIGEGQIDGAVADRIAKIFLDPALATVLADRDEVALLGELARLRQQRRGLERLRVIVEDAATTEQDIQSVLRDEWWVFGGRFVDAAARRAFTVLDQFDVPLIRSDGSLQVIELKPANVPRLVQPHRSHLIVGPEVHEAASQAMNYLRALDEQRAEIKATFGIDTRRGFATVVIGHCEFEPAVSSEEIHETLRTYNSHLSRVEIITYDELIEAADRMLNSQSARIEEATSGNAKP